MEIRPVDNTARIVEATNHHEREHPQKRQQPRKKELISILHKTYNHLIGRKRPDH